MHHAAYTAGLLPAAPARARPPVCPSPASILQCRRPLAASGSGPGARQADCAIDEGLGAALTRRPAASTAALSSLTGPCRLPAAPPAAARSPAALEPRSANLRPHPACLRP